MLRGEIEGVRGAGAPAKRACDAENHLTGVSGAATAAFVYVGLGNPILTDDALGRHIAAAVARRCARGDAAFAETSVGGLRLADVLAGYERVLLVDAIQTPGGRPGEVYHLAGWRLNANDAGQDFWFPAFVLQPGQSCRVYTNQLHPEWCGFSFGRSSALWANDGECEHLFDASGTEVSTYCYP